jgi:hypothetical protein
MRAFQSPCPMVEMTLSRNCSTELVQPRPHVTVPACPLRLCARSSLMPTHFASHKARGRGMFLLRHCSSNTFPVRPCGMVRLSLRRLTVGFARSCSHPSRVESRRVKRGGGLNVLGVWRRPFCCLFSSTATKSVDRVVMPDLFLRLDHSDGRAVLVSFMICGLLLTPTLTSGSDSVSSALLPVHGNRSAAFPPARSTGAGTTSGAVSLGASLTPVPPGNMRRCWAACRGCTAPGRGGTGRFAVGWYGNAWMGRSKPLLAAVLKNSCGLPLGGGRASPVPWGMGGRSSSRAGSMQSTAGRGLVVGRALTGFDGRRPWIREGAPLP